MLTVTFLSCLFPLYHVMTAGGRDPALSHDTSYRLSATRGLCLPRMLTVNGRTETIEQTREVIPGTLFLL